ncbi:MAG: RimK family alpha-L-glutamate ligase, partial [Nanoarchaeota archaeon]
AVDLRTLEVHASSEGLDVFSGKKQLKDYDCIYIRGSFKYTLLQRAISRAFYNEAYLPIKPLAFSIAHDKFLTLLELLKNGVNTPKTYFAATTPAAKKILEDVQYPIVMKIPFGTQGKGVMMADSLMGAKTMLDALETFKQPYIIQEFIDADFTDIRAVVIGNKVIAMKRRAASEEMRANIHAGGKGELVEISPDIEQIALKSAKVLGADICAVDIMEGRKPSVIEVNLSPGLAGITKATKKNVAQSIAKYLAEQTQDYLKKKKAAQQGKIMNALPRRNTKILSTLDVRNGMIRLPKFVTDLSEFTMNDEITLIVDKGKVEIRDTKIKKE